MNSSMFCLLVGIDEWVAPILPTLDGCVNDIRTMEKIFLERYAVPNENLCVLLNEQATRENIEHQFRQHLIENAKRWRDTEEGESPAFVFYFAGHGSRAADHSGTQPDGLDETFVPQDSRTEGVFDVRDWELGSWIDDLNAYTENVTIFLDCCHAGSGTRDDQREGKNRGCPIDERRQPTSRPTIPSETRSTSQSTDKHVLIGACRSHEYAKEHIVVENGVERKQGAMTYFLSLILAEPTSNRPMTYRELHERLRYEVNSRYASQMPQCEGDRDRLLFGGIRPEQDRWMNLAKIEEASYWVDAGLTHGLTDGSVLSVYPPGTLLQQDAESTGKLVVETAEAVQSRCRLESGSAELFSKVTIERINSSLKRTVGFVTGIAPELKQQLQARLSASDASNYFDLESDSLAVDFCLKLDRIDNEEYLLVLDRSMSPLVQPIPASQVDLLARNLIGLARYFNALQLRNRSATSALAGKVSLTIHNVDPVLPTEIQTNDEGKPIRPVRELLSQLETDEGQPIVEIGKPIAIGVTNHADFPIYCEILNFSYDYEIRLLFQLLQGANKQIAAGKTVWLGRDGPLLQFQPPADPAKRAEFVEAREFLKVMATVDQTDFSLLQQASLTEPYQHRASPDSGLDQLMHQAMAGGDHRALGFVKTSAENDWTTVELEYVVRKSSSETT